MKNKFVALIAATFIATSASAGGFENQVFANKNVKAIELSQTEMQETQGEWAANAAGAVVGGVSAGAGYLLGGGKDPYKFMGQVGLGAAGGALNPLRAGAQATAALAKAATHASINRAAKHIATDVGKKALTTGVSAGGGSFVSTKFSGKYF